MTSPGDVEVSVEDIEDEEKLEQLGKAILCSRRLFFAYYLNMHYACKIIVLAPVAMIKMAFCREETNLGRKLP